ncbi:SDR family oxidoreductase [Enterobacter soli]|jgi:nucleoside-diphosphate-sugar epimerase|uniref:SDR family oxidoreductase n=1 Tax=Enterobacter soli TaxID=885040 RepID=UPI00310B2EA3
MRLFLTGATGFIGSRIAEELKRGGHRVIGLARSQASAERLLAAGIEVQRGTIDEPETLLPAVENADAVIHTAFDHDFSRFVANCEKDRQVINTLSHVLKGSARPLIITSGTGMGDPENGRPAAEAIFNRNHPNPRIASELAGHAALENGVDLRVVRLPQVHDTRRQGLISYYIQLCREKGAAAWIDAGTNCWSAAHVDDVARLYCAVLEKGSRGERYHAVAEEAIPSKMIAETVAAEMALPTLSLAKEEADAWFGWFAAFAKLDLRASGIWTQEKLGWQPVGPGLLDDLRAMNYSEIAH